MSSTQRKAGRQFDFFSDEQHELAIKIFLVDRRIGYSCKVDFAKPVVYFTVTMNQNYWLTIRGKLLEQGITVTRVRKFVN